MTTGPKRPVDYWKIIPDYDNLLQQLARRIKGRSPMVSGLETDDLEQEGRIAIWQCVEAGKTPSKQVIQGRMLNWVRFLRQADKAVSYNELLPSGD